jgi:AraC-like DNA-binding protein
MSPLQYQKQIRLQEARRLPFTERRDAATVAFQVGYASPSQFSREYLERLANLRGRMRCTPSIDNSLPLVEPVQLLSGTNARVAPFSKSFSQRKPNCWRGKSMILMEQDLK